jgi:hypothetical protein
MGNGFAEAFFEALSIKLIAFLRAKDDNPAVPQMGGPAVPLVGGSDDGFELEVVTGNTHTM